MAIGMESQLPYVRQKENTDHPRFFPQHFDCQA